MAYQLKITLLDSSAPVVWRRIVMDSFSDFEDLHVAIQGAFGWEMSHLWEFSPTKGRSNLAIVMPDADSEWIDMDDREIIEADIVSLEEYLVEVGNRMFYLYDFGDSWYHEILLEAIMPDEEFLYEVPQVIEGQGACPPEDCGGVGGYHWMKQVLRDPDHPDHEHYREWMGLEDDEEFDPEYFDLEEAQEDINAMFEEMDDLFDFEDEDDMEDGDDEDEDFDLDFDEEEEED